MYRANRGPDNDSLCRAFASPYGCCFWFAPRTSASFMQVHAAVPNAGAEMRAGTPTPGPRPGRMLRIEVAGESHDWFDVDEMANAVRSPSFAATLRSNITGYFGVPIDQQVIFDDDGLLVTAADISRALQRVSPALYVYDFRNMTPDQKQSVVAGFQRKQAGVGQSLSSFRMHGSCRLPPEQQEAHINEGAFPSQACMTDVKAVAEPASPRMPPSSATSCSMARTPSTRLRMCNGRAIQVPVETLTFEAAPPYLYHRSPSQSLSPRGSSRTGCLSSTTASSANGNGGFVSTWGPGALGCARSDQANYKPWATPQQESVQRIRVAPLSYVAAQPSPVIYQTRASSRSPSRGATPVRSPLAAWQQEVPRAPSAPRVILQTTGPGFARELIGTPRSSFRAAEPRPVAQSNACFQRSASMGPTYFPVAPNTPRSDQDRACRRSMTPSQFAQQLTPVAAVPRDLLGRSTEDAVTGGRFHSIWS